MVKTNKMKHAADQLGFAKSSCKVKTNRMSKDQLDSVVKHAESLLSLAVQMHVQRQEETAQLVTLAKQQREESQNLHGQSALLQQDMAKMQKSLEALIDTKVAFEAKERQARKLSKQL
ncbi:hypothetical protein E1301_Tti008244 [Triplophysa tibetana]|uniref:Uncharacterized protein n=1 Tax=Triplophysa tibetana TaxID=1572043 RepID=A0A5A9PGQ4_9TELE|nr:hypothetical protein E1301_Tti008244 [Triplophysa tibetana]